MNVQNGEEQESAALSLEKLTKGLGSRYLIRQELVGQRLVLSVVQGSKVVLRVEAGLREEPDSIATRWVSQFQRLLRRV